MVRPSTVAHTGFAMHDATEQSRVPHVTVVTLVPCAPHTSATASDEFASIG